MKIRKFNENSSEQRRYLSVPSNVCPVCGEKDDIIVWSSSGGIENAEETMFLDYECRRCNFQWYSEYTLSNISSSEGGDEIKPGKLVPDNYYNPEKLEAEKYNL